jgi:hypothetical protein
MNIRNILLAYEKDQVDRAKREKRRKNAITIFAFCAAILAGLLLAAMANAQSNVPPVPQAPPVVIEPPPVVEEPDVKPQEKDAYVEARREALEKGQNLVVFVGSPARYIPESTTVSVGMSKFAGYPAKCIIVGNVEGNWKATLDADAIDKQIIAAIKGVQPPADPFDKSNNRDQQSALPDHQEPVGDSSSPWLPEAEQKKVRDMWPDGVTRPKRLRFYKIPKSSQAVASYTGGGPIIRFTHLQVQDDNINLKFPYIGSGGMDWAKAGTWRNVTGMSLPEGAKIATWHEQKPLKNSMKSFQNELSLFWKFPKGTEMFDVLIRRNDDGTEHIFNVRRRTKISDTEWDDGASFLPYVKSEYEEKFTAFHTDRSKRLFSGEKLTYRYRKVAPMEIDKYPFKEQTIAMSDGGHFFPPGFVGTGVSCNKCHSIPSLDNQKGSGQLSGEIADYGGPFLRGMDTVYSWSPADLRYLASHKNDANVSPVTPLDRRWPLEVR